MGLQLWVYLVANLPEPQIHSLGIPAIHPHKRKLLVEWSTQLGVAKTGANVKYGNKVVQIGPVNIAPAKGGTRPSRCVPNVRSLHFLNPAQVKNMKSVGSGIQ